MRIYLRKTAVVPLLFTSIISISTFFQGPAEATSCSTHKLIQGHCIKPGANLSGLSAVNVNFSGVNLSGVNLNGASLLRSNFAGANLTGRV